MSRNLSNAVLAVAVCLFPAQLLAGGPAWLVVPIDGVTSTNQERCSQLLASGLEQAVFEIQNGTSPVQIQKHLNQWYATFHLRDDVKLSEIEAALKGSPFSIPRDRLRLFGHVILEIKSQSADLKPLKGQLAALEYVAVPEVQSKADSTELTVDMPYPTEMRRKSDGVRFWPDSYQWNDLNTPTTRTDTPVNSQTLPSPKDLRSVLARHNAELKDLRWSPEFHCRPIGSVAVPKNPETAKVK